MSLLSLPVRAQQDSLSDVFPLGLGNSWVYDFTGYGGGSHSSTFDTGSAVSQIVAVTRLDDSTLVWRFRIRKDYTETTYTYGSTRSHIIDTTFEDVHESLKGTHELTVSPGEFWVSRALYPLKACLAPLLSRYSTTDADGTLAFYRSDWNCTYPANLMLRKDIGVISSVFTNGLNNTARFTFVSFTRGHADARLIHPSGVSLWLLVGAVKDTSVVLTNDGTDTLQIQSITTSDPGLSATLSLTSIPFLVPATLRLRFTSSIAGTRQAKVVIRSNATTSPDTVTVTVANTSTGIASIDRKLVDLPQFDILWRHIESPLALTNTGNAPLRLDSVTTTNKEFRLLLEMSPLGPGVRREFQVQYIASEKPWDRIRDTLYLHSSSAFSPDTIRVSAWAYGGVFVTDSHLIDFGSVKMGSHADVILRFRELGYSTIGLRRVMISAGPFGGVNSLDTVCAESAVVDDVVRFAPGATGTYEGYAVYTTLSGASASPDTVWLKGQGIPGGVPASFGLRQNYPNPFNGSTTVQIDIPEACELTFTVTDVLGRIVRTSTETVPAGVQMKTVDARGLSSGVYFYSVQAGKYTGARKMLLVR